MKFVKAIRWAFKGGKLGAGLGTFAGALIGILDDKSKKPDSSAATGLAVGGVMGTMVGAVASVVDDHFEIHRRQS